MLAIAAPRALERLRMKIDLVTSTKVESALYIAPARLLLKVQSRNEGLEPFKFQIPAPALSPREFE